MKITRRRFLLGSGATGLFSLSGVRAKAQEAYSKVAAIARGKVTTTICPYCAVGCGALVTTKGGKVVCVEGDPDHPINEGALCSKGEAMIQIVNNERRLSKVKYRDPYSNTWKDKDWDWALRKIADNIKKTRDSTFRARDENGRLINRTEGIACLGGAALDNEECYAYSKFARGIGVVYLEHQARI